MIKGLKVILVCLLIAGCTTTGQLTSNKATTSHYTLMTGGELPELQRGLIVKHVELDFDVFPENKAITGKTRYTLETLKPITKMSLDLDAVFKVNEIKFNQQVLKVADY
ncbi:MAG: hypothetical protein ACSHWU_11130, partial [Marinicella sp.]